MNSEPHRDESPRFLIISRWVSLVFHPVFVSLLLFVVAIFFSPDGDGQAGLSRWLVLLITLLFVVVIPILHAAWLIRKKRISSWDMPHPLERRRPLLSMIFLTIVLQVLFMILGVTGLASYLPGLGLGLSGTVFLVNLLWKISIHLVSMGSLSAFVVWLFPVGPSPRYAAALTVCFLVSLVTALARHKLKAHTPAQLVVGWIVGFAITIIFFVIF